MIEYRCSRCWERIEVIIKSSVPPIRYWKCYSCGHERNEREETEVVYK